MPANARMTWEGRWVKARAGWYKKSQKFFAALFFKKATAFLSKDTTRMTGVLTSFSTDAVPEADRLAYWHEDVLRRLDTSPTAGMAREFAARVLHFSGNGAELLQHSGSALIAKRDAARIRRDESDDISLNFVVKCERGTVSHAGRHTLRAGDLMIVDLARPSELRRASHRVISLFLPRARVAAAYGDPAQLGGRMLARGGMPAMLRAHMQNAMDQALGLLPTQRVMAANIASEMAISILQSAQPERYVTEEGAAGLYHAAMLLIARECGNPELSPMRIAAALGCSRAALYRAFGQCEQTISAAIWEARLARAHAIMRAPAGLNAQINDISFRSGFHEITTFNKMFRKKYGMTPSDMRAMKNAFAKRRTS